MFCTKEDLEAVIEYGSNLSKNVLDFEDYNVMFNSVNGNIVLSTRSTKEMIIVLNPHQFEHMHSIVDGLIKYYKVLKLSKSDEILLHDPDMDCIHKHKPHEFIEDYFALSTVMSTSVLEVGRLFAECNIREEVLIKYNIAITPHNLHFLNGIKKELL